MIKDSIISPEKALQRAQALCARQERCSHDIRLKLRQWKLSNADIEKIVKQLIADSFINDERYAKMFVRDKSKFNKWLQIYVVKQQPVAGDFLFMILYAVKVTMKLQG